MKMADLILMNSEKIAKFAKMNSLQNYLLYGILITTIIIIVQQFCDFHGLMNVNTL